MKELGFEERGFNMKGERWESGDILRNGEFTGMGETEAADIEVVIIS